MHGPASQGRGMKCQEEGTYVGGFGRAGAGREGDWHLVVREACVARQPRDSIMTVRLECAPRARANLHCHRERARHATAAAAFAALPRVALIHTLLSVAAGGSSVVASCQWRKNGRR